MNAEEIYRLAMEKKRQYEEMQNQGRIDPRNIPPVRSGKWQEYPIDYKAYERVAKTIDPLILFFGFQGILANKYSIVEEIAKEEITARLTFDQKKKPAVAWSFMNYKQFLAAEQMFKGSPNELSEIAFDDAMNIIRVGLTDSTVEEFEEPEEDEFDDNCVDSCKPGNHACGK